MHVLIVDDEPLAREELSYLVSQHPQVTSVAEAGFCGGGNGRDDGSKARFVIFRYSFDR